MGREVSLCANKKPQPDNDQNVVFDFQSFLSLVFDYEAAFFHVVNVYFSTLMIAEKPIKAEENYV